MKTDILGRPTAAQKALWEMEGRRFKLECLRYITMEWARMCRENRPIMADLCYRESPEELGR